MNITIRHVYNYVISNKMKGCKANVWRGSIATAKYFPGVLTCTHAFHARRLYSVPALDHKICSVANFENFLISKRIHSIETPQSVLMKEVFFLAPRVDAQ